MARAKRPKDSQPQRIGRLAESAFGANRPQLSWVCEEVAGKSDVGIDYTIKLVDEDDLHYSQFYAQLKGSTQKREDGSSALMNAAKVFYSVPLDVATLNWYANLEGPKMLVFADLAQDAHPKNCGVYYKWIDDDLERLLNGRDELPLEPQSHTFHIPVSNRLDEQVEVKSYIDERLRYRRIGVGFVRAVEDAEGRTFQDAEIVVERLQASRIAVESLLHLPTRPWIDAPEDSLAGELRQASMHLGVNAIDLAAPHLKRAEAMLDSATKHETAEYGYLRGKAAEIVGDYPSAIDCYRRAREVMPGIEPYDVAWAEALLREADKVGAEVLLGELEGKAGKIYPLLRAKILALVGRGDEAVQEAALVEGTSGILCRCVISYITEDATRALQACEEGLADDDSASPHQRMSFLQIKANLLFEKGSPPQVRGASSIPILGLRDMDPDVLREAWHAVLSAWAVAELLNFPGQVELSLDISVVLSCYFNEVDRILAFLRPAAKKHQRRPAVQRAALELALFNNDNDLLAQQVQRLPDGVEKTLYQTRLFEMRGDKAGLVDLVVDKAEELVAAGERYLLPIEVATVYAHKLLRRDDEERLRGILAPRPHGAERAAVLNFLIKRNENPLLQAEAVEDLLTLFQAGGRSEFLCENLFRYLDPNNSNHAKQLIALAPALEQHHALPLWDLLKLCQAGLATRRWEYATQRCDEVLARFGEIPLAYGMKALALDEMGASPDALRLLERTIADGLYEPALLERLALISSRSGLHEKARAAFEQIWQRDDDPRLKGRALLAMLKLQMSIDPGHSRALEYWKHLGALVDPDDELEEGTYLLLFLQIGNSFGIEHSDDLAVAYRERLDAYTKRFPESAVLRKLTVPNEHLVQGMLDYLNRMMGVTPDLRANRERVAEMVRRGAFTPPFALRPTFLPEVSDVLALFEAMRRSPKRYPEYVLEIGNANYPEDQLAQLSQEFPLVDELSLLILDELDVLHHLFAVFPKVAILRASLTRIQAWAQSHYVSVFHERARALSHALVDHVHQIHQIPLPADHGGLGINVAQLQALQELLQASPLLYFCDDARTRHLVLQDRVKQQSLTTPDFLCLLLQKGVLTEREVAELLGRICEWNVDQIGVRLRYILLLADGVDDRAEFSTVVAELESRLAAYLEILWDTRKGYVHCLKEAGSFLGFILAGPESQELGRATITETSIAAFWHTWYRRVQSLPDGENRRVDYCARTAIQSARWLLANNHATTAVAQRLWTAHHHAWEALMGHGMTAKQEQALVATVAVLLAGEKDPDRVLDGTVDGLASFLLSGLPDGRPRRTLFNEAYAEARVRFEFGAG